MLCTPKFSTFSSDTPFLCKLKTPHFFPKKAVNKIRYFTEEEEKGFLGWTKKMSSVCLAFADGSFWGIDQKKKKKFQVIWFFDRNFLMFVFLLCGIEVRDDVELNLRARARAWCRTYSLSSSLMWHLRAWCGTYELVSELTSLSSILILNLCAWDGARAWWETYVLKLGLERENVVTCYSCYTLSSYKNGNVAILTTHVCQTKI